MHVRGFASLSRLRGGGVGGIVIVFVFCLEISNILSQNVYFLAHNFKTGNFIINFLLERLA